MLMSDKAWKLCMRTSDAKLGVPQSQGQHPMHSKRCWIEACMNDNILGYWDWVVEEDERTLCFDIKPIGPPNKIIKENQL